MNETIRQFCESHRDEFGDYIITEIPTDNGCGYLISYGPEQTMERNNNANNRRQAAMIVSDKATIDSLNAVIELKPASVGDGNTSAQSVITYHEFYDAVESGDMSMIPSNAVITIPATNYKDWYKDLDLACSLIEDNGGTVKNIGELGFSMSGGSAVESAAKSIISERHPEATYRVANCDAVYQEMFISGTHQKEYTEEQRALIRDKMEIVNFIPDENSAKYNTAPNSYVHQDTASWAGHRYGPYSYFKRYAEGGYNSGIYEVNHDANMTSGYTQHATYRDLALYGSNTLDWMAGNDNYLYNKTDEYGLLGDRKFFNLETGTYDVLPNYGPSANVTTTPFSYLDYLSDEDYEITPYEVESAYKELKDIGNVGISYLDNPELQSKLHDQTIVSDLQVVSDHMTAIRNSIKSSSATGSFQGLSFGGSGAGGMLGCIMGYIQAYYNAVGALLSSLTAETDSITSFAQAYADMDADYTNKAGDIMAMDLDGNMKKLDLSTISKPAETPSSGSVNYNETGNQYRPSETGTTSGGTVTVPDETKDTDTGYTRPDLSIKEKEDGTTITEAAYDDDSRRVTTYDETGSKVDTEITDSSVSPAASIATGSAAGATAGAAAGATSSSTVPKTETSAPSEIKTEAETSDKQYTRPNVTVNEKEDGTVEVIPTSEGENDKIVMSPGSTVGAGTGTAASSSIDTDSGAIRPTYESGEPIRYRRFNKKVDGDEVTYTYYDKQGNEIGKTVTEKGQVKEAYYDYVGDDGNVVRVDYDKSAGSEAASTGEKANIIMEDASTSESSGTNAERANIIFEEPTESQREMARRQAEDEVMWEKTLGTETGATVDERVERILNADRVYQEAKSKSSGTVIPNNVVSEAVVEPVPEVKTPDTVVVTPTVTPTESVPEVKVEPTPSKPSTTTTPSRPSTGGGGWSGGTTPSTPTPTPTPTPEVKPEPVPEVIPEPTPEIKPEPTPAPEVKPEPVPEVKPTPAPSYTPTYTPKTDYTPTSEPVESDIPYIEDEVVIPEPEVTPVTPEPVSPTHKNNTGKILGTLAGLAAAGAGAAGIAHTAKKMKEESENEDFDEEFSEEDFDEDNDEEVNLSDEI